MVSLPLSDTGRSRRFGPPGGLSTLIGPIHTFDSQAPILFPFAPVSPGGLSRRCTTVTYEPRSRDLRQSNLRANVTHTPTSCGYVHGQPLDVLSVPVCIVCSRYSRPPSAGTALAVPPQHKLCHNYFRYFFTFLHLFFRLCNCLSPNDLAPRWIWYNNE